MCQSDNSIRIDADHNCYIKSKTRDGVYPINGIYPSFIANTDIKPQEKLMYMLLKSLANKHTGIAFPKKIYLAETLGISDRQVSNVLNEMVKKGMIYIVNRKWADTKTQTSNMYIINSYDIDTGKFDTGNLDKYRIMFPPKQSYYFVSTLDSQNRLELLAIPPAEYEKATRQIEAIRKTLNR